MKAISVVKFLIVTSMIGILISSSSASQIVVDQSRPDIIYRENTQFMSNELIKGNNSNSRLEFLVNSATYAGERATVRGDVNVTQTNNTIDVSGQGQANIVSGHLSTVSGIQFDSYFEDLPVDQRFNLRPISNTNTRESRIDIDRTFTTPFTFSGLQNNDNFTEITRENLDATAFLYRSGVIGSATINDTDGNPLATVIGFTMTIRIIIYQTSSQDLVGVYSGDTRGFGNIFSSRVINYLSNQSFVHVSNNVDRLGQLDGQDRISWFYTGYNDSLGLDLYRAQFHVVRQSSAILIAPNSDSTGLGLNQISLGMELFLNDLESSNELHLDVASTEDFDAEVVDNAIDKEVPVQSTANPDVASSDVTLNLSSTMIFGGQVIALLIVGKVFLRRFYK